MGNVSSTEDVTKPVAAKSTRFDSLRFVFMNGKPAPEAFKLHLDRAREHSIGRDPSAVSFVVPDSTVSAVHARLRFDGERWLIRDEQSRHGTYVDGVLARDWTPLLSTKPLLRNTVVLLGDVLAVAGEDGTVRGGDPLGGLTGRSYKARVLFQDLRAAAAQDCSLILAGATGTGKSHCAQAIHEASHRKAHPFFGFSCADVNTNVFESELFGHKAGSFTGASANRPGHFVAAGGGIVFLDEIGELPMHLQAKLLAVLQTKTVLPVGGDAPIQYQARVISASNRDLKAEVKAGRFREDLFHRLNGRPIITVPTATERKADLVAFVAQFLGEQHWCFTPHFLHAILRRPWEGNIRELTQFLTGAVQPRLPDDDEHLLEPITALIADYMPEAHAELTEDQLVALLKRCEGNISAVSRLANRDRSTVRRMMKRWKLNASDYSKDKPS